MNDSLVHTGMECSYLSNLWSWRRARQLTGWEFEKDYGKHPINSGWFVAPSHIMKKIVAMEVAVYGPNMNVRSSDQLIYDWLIFSGNFHRAGVDFHFYNSEESKWPSIARDLFGYNISNIGEFYHWKTGIHPLLLHQYSRNYRITTEVVSKCKGSEFKYPLYVFCKNFIISYVVQIEVFFQNLFN